jgi:Aspartyl/Asparaginyl beta-hydroxylase
MLDLPGAPYLDKDTLIGGCVRLPLRVDSQRLFDEIQRIPQSAWGTRGGRIGVHRVAEAIFLRGFAPAEGDLPIEDRPILSDLPYVQVIVRQLIAAPPLRCLLARLPAGGIIRMHRDSAPYFGKTLRVHVPVETNELVAMLCRGLCYQLECGEVWVLNNSAEHAVCNSHPSRARTHLICDFLPTPGLLEMLDRGDRHLGRYRREIEQQLRSHDATGMRSSG